MRAVDSEVVDNRERRQFEIRVGDHVARLTYALRDGVIELIHTEVPRPLEGRGIANQLAVAALEFAARESLRVIPTCPFVQTFIQRHPQYAKLTHRNGD